MTRRYRSIAVALAAALLTAVAAFAADEPLEVVADGYGETREAALQDAKHTAIAIALGETIESRTLVENFALVSDRILSSASGYVRTFEVVGEGESDAGYHVRIRAVVGETLATDLDEVKVLSAEQGNPRFVVVPDPAGSGDGVAADDRRAAGRGIESYMVENGFELIHAPRYNVETGLSSPAALRDLSGWAAGLGAEYVIYYTVTALEKPAGRIFRRATAYVELHAVHTGSYRVVAETDARGSAGDQHEEIVFREACRNAGRNAAEQAAATILADWSRTGTTAGRWLSLTVQGIPDDRTQLVAQALQRTGVVKQVEIRAGDRRAGFVYDVTADGSLADLVGAFDRLARESRWRWALVDATSTGARIVIVRD